MVSDTKTIFVGYPRRGRGKGFKYNVKLIFVVYLVLNTK